MTSIDFTIGDATPTTSPARKPLPAGGDYAAEVTDVEVRAGAKGRYLNVTCTITSDRRLTDVDRRVYDVFSIWNDRESTRARAIEDLNRLCQAAGLPAGKELDTDDLVGRRVILTLSIEAAKDGWPAKNRVARYDRSGSVQSAPIVQPAPASQPASPRQAPAGNPWDGD